MSETSITLPTGRGKNRTESLKEFSIQLKAISRRVSMKMSARGWAYALEGMNIIDKSQFDQVNNAITECRKRGYLPINFVAEDEARSYDNVFYKSSHTKEEYMLSYLKAPLILGKWYDFDVFDGEKYFLALMVEKVDLITLFEPICKEYYIPLANTRGWYSIHQRANIAEMFKEHEDAGRKCVLLYCGDFDPFGLSISDNLMNNFKSLEKATEWNPDNLIINRFGLNYDFIESNKLSWIDNLISGSGKKPDKKNSIVSKYIAKYGERKCEANAIVVNPEAGRVLFRSVVEKYNKGFKDRVNKKRQECIKEFNDILDKHGVREPLEKLVKSLEND